MNTVEGVSAKQIKMATVSLAFRWLDMLEKEFDKGFVDLDLLLGEIDPDQCELTYDGRQKMTALSAAFAQLCHKAQTIFQSNAKLEVSIIVNSILSSANLSTWLGDYQKRQSTAMILNVKLSEWIYLLIYLCFSYYYYYLFRTNVQ